MSKKEELKKELFLLEMKDRWTNQDYIKIKELREQIKEIEKSEA